MCAEGETKKKREKGPGRVWTQQHTHTHARTHARTRTRTHAHTHSDRQKNEKILG
jgi:hypothetical protein